MLDWVQMINALQRSSQSTFSSHRPFQPLLRNIAGEVEQGNTFLKRQIEQDYNVLLSNFVGLLLSNWYHVSLSTPLQSWASAG